MKDIQTRAKDWQAAFAEGMRARLEGKHISDCPYTKSNSTKADGWKKGFIRQNSLMIKAHTHG